MKSKKYNFFKSLTIWIFSSMLFSQILCAGKKTAINYQISSKKNIH